MYIIFVKKKIYYYRKKLFTCIFCIKNLLNFSFFCLNMKLKKYIYCTIKYHLLNKNKIVFVLVDHLNYLNYIIAIMNFFYIS